MRETIEKDNGKVYSGFRKKFDFEMDELNRERKKILISTRKRAKVYERLQLNTKQKMGRRKQRKARRT